MLVDLKTELAGLRTALVNSRTELVDWGKVDWRQRSEVEVLKLD